MFKSQVCQPVDVTRLLDQSGSMRKLAATVIETFRAYELAMARDMPGSMIRRVLFNDRQTELERDFTDPAALARPLQLHYRPEGLTYLYRFASHQINKLISRAIEVGSERRQVLIVTTDGLNKVPDNLEHCYGQARMTFIRTQLMPEFWRIAVGDPYPELDRIKTKRLNSSPIAVWYQGIGESKEHHWKQAQGMGIPRQWFSHVPATPEGLRQSQQRVTDSSRSFAEGGGTEFEAIDSPPESSSSDWGHTAFGARP